MTLASLQHLVRAARSLAEDKSLLVLGSASLLATFPELGDPEAPLSSTYDADLCPEPFDELTAVMLDEALGESRAYYRRHGYHADILRDSVFETLPAGWRERLVPVPGVDSTRALDPHDLAAVKVLVGRPKDLDLVSRLHAAGLLKRSLVRERLDGIAKSDRDLVRAGQNFHQIFESSDPS
ncbi:MAG: hypothetical protein WD342_15025 [Verrucomicrobiales bacterium]